MGRSEAEATALREPTEREPLTPDDLRLLDAYWRAANYLSVGQVYLLANPLVRQPLKPEHVKPRLLGHFSTARSGRATSTRSTSPARATAGRRSSPTRISRERTARSTRTSARTRKGFGSYSGSSRSPAESPVTSRLRFPDRFTKEGSLGTRWRTPSARLSTTPICSRLVSWETARRKPGPSPRAGTRTSS